MRDVTKKRQDLPAKRLAKRSLLNWLDPTHPQFARRVAALDHVLNDARKAKFDVAELGQDQTVDDVIPPAKGTRPNAGFISKAKSLIGDDLRIASAALQESKDTLESMGL